MRKDPSLLHLSLAFSLLILISCDTLGAGVSDITIINPSGATTAERLAAKEVRRYLYLRTGKLFTIVQTNNIPPLKNPLIIVGQKTVLLLKPSQSDIQNWQLRSARYNPSNIC